jgi:hypothetical protein
MNLCLKSALFLTKRKSYQEKEHYNVDYTAVLAPVIWYFLLKIGIKVNVKFYLIFNGFNTILIRTLYEMRAANENAHHRLRIV